MVFQRDNMKITHSFFILSYNKIITEFGLDFAAKTENSFSSKGLMQLIPVPMISLVLLPAPKETSRRNVPSIVNICKNQHVI